MTTTGMSASSQSLSAQAEVSVFGITRWYSRYALPNAKPSAVVTHQQREAELSDIADGGVIATDPVSQPQAVAANNDSPTAPVQALSSGTETAQQVAPHAKRVARLTELGHGAEAMGRIHAPVGLNIEAITAPEIALSIMAEIVAARRGAALGAVRPIPGVTA